MGPRLDLPYCVEAGPIRKVCGGGGGGGIPSHLAGASDVADRLNALNVKDGGRGGGGGVGRAERGRGVLNFDPHVRFLAQENPN